MSRILVSFLRTVAGALALALPLLAGAQQLAYVDRQMNLRAGPGSDYPMVALMHRGVQLTVHGCTPGYQWCDVQLADGLRGWAYAPYLSYPQYGRSVALPNAAVAIGIPLLGFTLGSYWSDHYRDRSWYEHPRWNPRPGRPGPRTWSWEDRDNPRHPGRRYEDARRPPRAGEHWDSDRSGPRPQARPERRERSEAQRPQPQPQPQRAQPPQRAPEQPRQPRAFDGNNPPNDPAGANRP